MKDSWKDFWKGFWKNIGIPLIPIAIIVVGYFGVVKENQNDINDLKIAFNEVKESLGVIKSNQIKNTSNLEHLTKDYDDVKTSFEIIKDNKHKITRLIDDNKNMSDTLQNISDTLQGTQTSLRALILAIAKKIDIESDYQFFLSLNNYLGKLPIKQSIEIANKIHERDEIIKNIDKYTIYNRSKIAKKFLEDIAKYDLSYNDKVAMAEHLFKAGYGVGGGE